MMRDNPSPALNAVLNVLTQSARTIPAPEGHSTPISESTELRVPIDSAVELASAEQIVGPPENDTLIYAGKPSPPLIGEQDRTKPDNGQSLSSADLALHALRVLTIAVEAGVIESAAPAPAESYIALLIWQAYKKLRRKSSMMRSFFLES